MRFETCTAAAASKMIHFPLERPASTKLFLEASKGGAYLGNTMDKGIPCFMNFDLLMNPHIFICGMTGSGKTYAMRSLVLRLFTIAEYSVLAIDFTGEYSDAIRSLNGAEVDARGAASITKESRSVLHLNLSNLTSEAQKMECAKEALERIVEAMRASGISKGVKGFVLLDEAWKLLSGNVSFGTILREGRKYGIGFILGSQLLEDVDSSMLNNIASILVFRLQDRETLRKLSANYGLGDELEGSVQNLFLGGCLLIQVYRSKKRTAFRIRRIMGVSARRLAKITFVDSMWIELEAEKLEAMLRSLCGAKSAEMLSRIQKNGEIGLCELIRVLLEAGANGREVLLSLRRIGIGDAELSEAFSIAVASTNGKGFA